MREGYPHTFPAELCGIEGDFIDREAAERWAKAYRMHWFGYSPSTVVSVDGHTVSYSRAASCD